MTIDFGTIVDIGTVFVFTNKLQYTSGVLDVYVHSSPTDAFDTAHTSATLCGQFGDAQGGVMECNTFGTKLTLYCSGPTGCQNQLSVRMVRAWPEIPISINRVPVPYGSSTLSVSDNDSLVAITGDDSLHLDWVSN